MDEVDANKTAEFILSTMQNLAVGYLGETAGMNVIEASLLATSLPKILQSLEVNTLERMSGVLYPIMGVMGLGLWGVRIASIYSEKQKGKQAQEENNNQSNFSENGVANEWQQSSPVTSSPLMKNPNLPL